jgi:hypothetical protein
MSLFRASANDPNLIVDIALGLRDRPAIDQPHQWSQQQIGQADKARGQGSVQRMARAGQQCNRR